MSLGDDGEVSGHAATTLDTIEWWWTECTK